MYKKPVSNSLVPIYEESIQQEKTSEIPLKVASANQIIDFEIFGEEFKKQFETSVLGSLWNSITRTKRIIKLEDLLLFIKKFPPQIEFVENVCKKLEKEFSGILKYELKKITISKVYNDVHVEVDLKNEMNVKCELKSWNPININISIQKVKILVSEKSLYVCCRNDFNISWEWRSSKPDKITVTFFKEFETELLTVSDENISNDGLLNGKFDIYGTSDKLNLLKYWKDKKVSYRIKTGRKAIISDSKILFRNFELVFEKVIYNIENVNPERIESITYRVDFDNYLSQPLKVQRIILCNISFYSTCILMSKLNPTLCNNYHNMVTYWKGKAEIGISLEQSHWIGGAKRKAYKYNFENNNFGRTGFFSAGRKMLLSTNDCLLLEGFCYIRPFSNREIMVFKKPLEFESLSRIYEFSHEALQLTKSQPNLYYLPTSVNAFKVTGHFEGILQFFCDYNGNLLSESNFFIDTILGYVQLDLSHFGLGWCKFYKISQPKSISISTKCPTDISFICLD